MAVRTFFLVSAILVLAVPVATATNNDAVAVEAIMTLRSLGGASWILDVQNSTPAPVTIRRVTWTAPDGLTVGRIVRSRGGTCASAGGGFRCTTQLAPASCASCAGGDLSVQFTGTGPGRKWVATTSNGYWKIGVMQAGDAELIGSAVPAQESTRRSP